MKEIKIIDLLNMIAESKKVPKKIKYENVVYTLNYVEEDYYCPAVFHGLLDKVAMFSDLNRTVEIIEEDNNKIKKICTFPSLEDDDYAYEDGDRPNNVLIHNPIEQLFIKKINEIIDKINNME